MNINKNNAKDTIVITSLHRDKNGNIISADCINVHSGGKITKTPKDILNDIHSNKNIYHTGSNSNSSNTPVILGPKVIIHNNILITDKKDTNYQSNLDLDNM